VRVSKSRAEIDGRIAESTFAELYARNSERVLRFFVRRVYEPEAALDLTAETFAEAFIGRERFRGSGDEEFSAWLFGIARHQLSRYLRRGAAERRAIERLGIEVPALTPEEHARIEELAELAELRAAAGNGLAALPEAQRRALRLRVIDELPYPQVASELGISEPTARARVSRGLRALADSIAKENG
jgi:RNA polymerase sigma factor (sigma-70 family)